MMRIILLLVFIAASCFAITVYAAEKAQATFAVH